MLRDVAGLVRRPHFRLPGNPVTELATIAFLLACPGMLWNDPEAGRKTLLPAYGGVMSEIDTASRACARRRGTGNCATSHTRPADAHRPQAHGHRARRPLERSG
ncbi:hypothetical protein [Streptomyces chromofuscus]|uniref:Uncharacterized protein n=1 Tax=Streptomyces chromofuscus TaxID=42881 RepID=A0A7M2TGM1_STRCW|nr:hypothetical protein [Streptomyces chromofuscus]QOV47900.1 hypothetical protein IPT68_31570 [Streptomyces chromofuscus]GGT05362.1 hypothetical protein GCM10010254_27030 [Streptomyces chromofuscus]